MAACGWPVLALDAVGRRLHGPSVPGVVRAAVGLLLWPAHLLASLLRAVARPGSVLDDYGADDAAGSAGLGLALVSVLERRTTGDAGAGVAPGLRDGGPAPALRIERLEPRRPLDAFFAPPEPGRARRGARYGWASLAVPVTVAVLSLGAWLSAAAATGEADTAVGTAASYTVAFLDASFHRPQVHQVIEAAVAPAVAPAVERQADSSPWGMAAALVSGAPTSSRATAIACATVPGRAPGAAVRVAVRVRWAYAIAGRARQVVVTELVPLRLVDGRWAPTAAPSPEPARPSILLAGLGPCPA